MKSKVFLILIGLFLCSFETHKYYVSTSLFEYKEKMNTIQVTVRVFEDDFINALNTRYQKDLDLDSDLNEPENKQLISDYLLVNLGVVAENQKLKFNFLGSEEKNDTTALYIEFDIFNSPKSIKISNSLFIELFDDQQNVIHFKTDIQRKSFLLNKDTQSVTIDL